MSNTEIVEITLSDGRKVFVAEQGPSIVAAVERALFGGDDDLVFPSE